MANVPESNYALNRELYGKDIDIENKETITKPTINGYIVWVMKIWKNSEYHDESLIEAFQEDFAGWTSAIFDVADRLLLRDLRDYLRHNGVLIENRPGVKYAKQLENVLTQDIEHVWTEQEIEYVTKRGHFNSRFNPQNKYSSISQTSKSDKLAESKCLEEKQSPVQESLINAPQYLKEEKLKDPDLNTENDYYKSRRPAIGTAVRNKNLSSVFMTSNDYNNSTDDQIYNNSDNEDNQQIFRYDQYYNDRKFYRGKGGQQGNTRGIYRQRYRGYRANNSPPSFRGPKKCWICKKEGCHSTKHTQEERNMHFNEFRQHIQQTQSRPTYIEEYQHFLIDYEGVQDSLGNNGKEIDALFASLDIENIDHSNNLMEQTQQFFAEL
ncbi:hypothetical protein OnM2_057062, partial [Erysiphe neolycopersici]